MSHNILPHTNRQQESDMPNKQQHSQPSDAENNQPNLLRTLTRIAALSLQATSNPHTHKDHPVALDLLRQAVEITRPWLDDVRKELEHHGAPYTEPDPHRGKGKGDVKRGFRGQLLSELPKLLPIVLKLLARDKGRKGDPRRLGMLRVLHDVLEGKIMEALGEIERLERGLARGNRRESGEEREREEGYDEKMRIREEKGLAGSYYSGEDVGDGEGRRGSGSGSQRGGDEEHLSRRRRRRRKGGGGHRRSSESHEHAERSGTEEHGRRSHANSSRDRSNAAEQERSDSDAAEQTRATRWASRRSHAQDHHEQQQLPDPSPRPLLDPSLLTASEREEAKKRALERYKALKSITKTQRENATAVPAFRQTNATMETPPGPETPQATGSASGSGTTESIIRSPPPPIGIHAPDAEFQIIERGDIEWWYRHDDVQENRKTHRSE